MEVIQLELKYCERCGSLWVRETGTGEIFCFPCVLKMQGLRLVPMCGEGGTA